MNSIRRRLTRDLLTALAVLLGLGLVAIGFTVHRRLTGAFDASLVAQARAVGALTELEGGHIQFDFSPEFMRGFEGLRARHFFEMWTESGNLVTRSPALGSSDLVRRYAKAPGRPAFYDVRLPSGRTGRAVCVTFGLKEGDDQGHAPGGRAETVTLVMASDRGELDETLRVLAAAVAGVGLLLVVAVLALVPRILARGLSPLDRLGVEVGRIEAHTLSLRLSRDELPAELGPIAGRLNDLLARLEASFDRERRFSADLAHELRTPLAELRSLLECALKWPEARDPTTDAEALAIAKELETLVGRMLAIARGERGGLSQTRERLAPVELVAECWQPLEAQATARGLHAKFSVEPGKIEGDRSLTRSILGNLFENAVCYAPSGTTVDVWGAPRDGVYRLCVANPSGDLSPEDVEKLFDRFWRKEAARSGGRHLGLGLNLASTLAQAQGWKLTATLDGEGRIVFALDMAQAPTSDKSTV